MTRGHVEALLGLEDGKDEKIEQMKEKKRVHSRAYHSARTKAIREGGSEVDLYLTSL